MVDDNANGLTARKTILEEQGHHVITASNGHQALEIFAEHKFDLVITDYKMPKMNGIELIAALRERTPNVRIVMLSGFADALGLTAQSTGADGVVQKSAHEVPHLVRMVTRVLLKKPTPRKKPPSSQGGAPTS
jgi:CheY-like chemotaxis protein